jgi:phage baseplate assembly protein W
MARDLGRVNVADLRENDYKVLGISINTSSNTAGPFSVNYTTIEQAKYNLINLILTKKGERLGQPEFGCDVWRVLFEPIISGDVDTKIENSIIDAVNTWLPYLTIDEIIVDINDEDIDRNTINLEIRFSLASNPNIGTSTTVTITN